MLISHQCPRCYEICGCPGGHKWGEKKCTHPCVPQPACPPSTQGVGIIKLDASAKGWLCPRCFRVNAPFIVTCSCKPLPTKRAVEQAIEEGG